ncbi:hypothetical protein WJX77_001022 [Trebouxia sp. C0004]
MSNGTILLAAADVVSTLERVARDVKAGSPQSPSAVCMHQIRHLLPPSTLVSIPGQLQEALANFHLLLQQPGTGSTTPGILKSKGTSSKDLRAVGAAHGAVWEGPGSTWAPSTSSMPPLVCLAPLEPP